MLNSCKVSLANRAVLVFSLVCLWNCPTLVNVHAADVVSYLPKHTLGYAVVKNIGEADQKISKLASLFNPNLPSPLVLAKSITGLSQGIDLAGDAAFAYRGNPAVPADPIPLVLLPIIDYETFASGIGADTTGEICRVRLAEVDLLFARQGEFALVMNVEHRNMMRHVLAMQPEANLGSFTDWVANNDISIIVSRYGLAHIARFGLSLETTAEEETFVEDDFDEIVINENLTQHDSWPLVEFARRNFRRVGIGLSLDDASNARLRWKGELLSPLQNIEESDISPQQRLVGYRARAYAMAGGGELPARAGEMLAEFMTSLSVHDAQQQGRAEFTREDWADERKSWDLALADIREVSLLMVPPAEGEPLLSTFFARLTVEDSAEYLASLKQSYELANDLTERSTSEIKMLYDLDPAAIGDVEGLSIKSDLDKATGDQNVEIWQAMLTACLGSEHTLAIHCSPVDKEHVFIGLQSKDKLLEFIEGFTEGKTGLATEATVQKTLDLIAPEVPYVQLVNPQGLVDVTSSWMKTLLVLGMTPQLPLYPSAPPIALTLESDQLGWQGEVVFPEESVKGLAGFVAELKKIFGQ